MSRYYVGVDVGTSSVRVALIDECGKLVRMEEEKLTIYEPKPDFYEQSSDEIWEKCCALIRLVSKEVKKEDIYGIGFDATCSLVVLDANEHPLQVNNDSTFSGPNTCYDVIMWMDHRAKEQAELINSDKHAVLRYVGGKMSLEMQPPKLLWLKQKNPTCWKRAAHFFDLPDFLTFKATGSKSRSLCSVTCKWGYTAEDGWQKDFWRRIGLDEVAENSFSKIGNEILNPGDAVGKGLSVQAARSMNLCSGTAVGTSLIDGHCGGVGTIGAGLEALNERATGGVDLTERIALICGTSSCHMAVKSESDFVFYEFPKFFITSLDKQKLVMVSKKAIFVPGVWGPYFSAMIPNLWLNEGGQSATGKVIDHIVESHPAYPELLKMSVERKTHPHICLNELARSLATSRGLSRPDFLAKDLHMCPDFHGNRSPLADPDLRGAVCGLTLDNSLDSLTQLYIATIQSLASGSLHILDAMESEGHSIKVVFMCGGLSKNPLFVQVHANVLGRPIVLGKESEAVLIGAGILGAYASQQFSSLSEAMRVMSHAGECVMPESEMDDFYKRKHKVFLSMLQSQLEYREIMS